MRASKCWDSGWEGQAFTHLCVQHGYGWCWIWPICFSYLESWNNVSCWQGFPNMSMISNLLLKRFPFTSCLGFKSLRSRGSTLRSACRPLGRSDSKKVHEGNVMTARVMVLMILAACKGCWSILEQPQSSLMSCHPTFQRMLKLLRIFKVTVKMCDFGGSTDKPLTLFSSNFAWCVGVTGFLLGWPQKSSKTTFLGFCGGQSSTV